jgi:hypothetical protein
MHILYPIRYGAAARQSVAGSSTVTPAERTLAIRNLFASRPAGDRFQQREHNGAVNMERTSRPHSGHGCGAPGSG